MEKDGMSENEKMIYFKKETPVNVKLEIGLVREIEDTFFLTLG
jgi:hypothetical protein